MVFVQEYTVIIHAVGIHGENIHEKEPTHEIIAVHVRMEYTVRIHLNKIENEADLNFISVYSVYSRQNTDTDSRHWLDVYPSTISWRHRMSFDTRSPL